MKNQDQVKTVKQIVPLSEETELTEQEKFANLFVQWDNDFETPAIVDVVDSEEGFAIDFDPVFYDKAKSTIKNIDAVAEKFFNDLLSNVINHPELFKESQEPKEPKEPKK